MKKMIEKFITDQSGATSIEYTLILAIVGLGVFTAFTLLGNALSTSLNATTTAYKDATGLSDATSVRQ